MEEYVCRDRDIRAWVGLIHPYNQAGAIAHTRREMGLREDLRKD